ncbi:Exocyst component Exo84, C-terminal [Parasponia andersonii]|uniref:Exocyst component Exo84, C-terminal n=1 Tax=Parasponia andersonii TaxID=3476 RepID=A0A2P5D2B4_PARAD|nr:Exocyst component Exo84, C-terminal [Parasponia andersonii]
MDSSTFSSISRGSFSSSTLGDSSELDANLTLSDRLKAFKTSQFDPDAYVTSKCHTMNEKEIRHLCSYLVDLKKASAEEMRKSVYANYAAFIRTSREISDLEGQLLSMRNLLSSQAGFVHSLAEGVRLDSMSSDQEDSTSEDTSKENRELSKMENWLGEFLDTLEVLLAEKRVEQALAALDEGEKIVEEANQRQALNPSSLLSLQAAITEQRQKLADQLAETMSQHSIRGVELRSAVLALKKLGDGSRAHTLLLSSHQQRLETGIRSLRSPSALCGGAYTTTFSQLVFSTIAQAAGDSLVAFGEEPAYTSELVTWAVKQTETLAFHLKRHVLVSSVASGGLRVAAECVQVCLGHCSLLEARGLALSSVLLRLFRPFIEQALGTSLKRIEQSSAALAAADDWSLVYPAGTRPLCSTMSIGNVNACQPKLSSSAHKFNSMVQDFLEDVGPLESLQMDGLTLEGVLQVFNSYVNLLINALPGSMENEKLEGFGNKIVRMAEKEAQQIALLANASLLADEILPRAALRLLPFQQSNRTMETPKRTPSERQNRVPEQREWKRRLLRSVDRLRDSFCRQHALDLIFTEDGDSRLCAHMYTSMDLNSDEPEWFPSQIFQELYARLTRIASIATDMFVGRERFATVLLIRLLETVILWLSNDQNFWEEIEAGHQPLGPLGLQQFYLDMEFVMLFSSQGRYLSRNLHQVIKDIIGRAMQALDATGIDPDRVLPEDDWFAEVAQIAIKMLTGKANFGNVERVTSPTSSSIYSHGSNLE